MIKKILGIAPKLELDGSYSPSKLALRLATKKKTDFEHVAYKKYEGKKSKILVIFTEEKNMKMQNGKVFSTGNHPVEALLPMMHLKNAGFNFEIATQTGKSVAFEMWAFPEKDENLKNFYLEYKSDFAHPKKISEFVNLSIEEMESFAAVFIPGGHGAMLGIPEDKNVGKILLWAHENNLFTITLCHGPSSLLSTMLNNQPFLYKDYKMAVFPDSVDKMTPKIGYLPGQMPWGLSEKLKSFGAKIVNKKADETTCIDRRLITGASPLASNNLGKLAVKTLLKELK
jgi:molecular chaperone Hsp31 and glyoxalase 3